MESLAGKVALVTGAGKGIGRAIALALAQEGVHVGLLARSEDQLQAVAAELTALGGKSAVVAADIADRAAVEAGRRAGSPGARSHRYSDQ